MKRKIITNPLKKTLLKGCLLLFLALFSTSLTAQITIEVSNKSIKEILKAVETKSEYRFFYNEGLKGLDKISTLKVNNATIDKIMSILLTDTEIDYKLDKKNLVVLVAKIKVNKSESKKINGLVTDIKGEPIIGAAVVLKGTNTGTITNTVGQFSLEVSQQSQIIISYIGFKQTILTTNAANDYKIILEEDSKALDEVVVVGYGSVKKTDLTGSVSVVNVKDLQQKSNANIAQALQGTTAGVRVKGSSEPGSNPSIFIRGISTLNNNSPLIIADGLIIDNISNISADDIESFQILKDASSAAIYGSRAANGVIIITTKRGKKDGKLTVDYNGYLGVQNIYQRFDMMDREEYQRMTNTACLNAGLPLAPGNDPQSLSFVNNTNTNWQNECFKQGKVTKQNISISGGNDISNFTVSGDYHKAESTIVGNGPNYERYNLRFNADHHYKKFSFGESIFLSKTSNAQFTSTQAYSGIINIAKAMPTLGIYDDKNIGGYAGPESEIQQGIALNMIGWNNLHKKTQDEKYVIAGLNAKYEIMPTLSIMANASYSTRVWESQEFDPLYRMGSYFSNTIAKFNDWRGEQSQALLNSYINYKEVFSKKHNVEFMAGYEVFNNKWADLQGHAEGYTEPYKTVIDNGPSERTSSGFKTESAYISLLSRLNYNFDNKYFLTASLRQDQTSKFYQDNRTGLFPSMALAWKIHNESFFKIPFINELKFRSSYGELGNSEVGDYIYQARLNTSAGYILGGNYTTGVTQTNIVNRDLKWESKKSFNIGFDLVMFENKFILNAEYYSNKSENILFPVDIPYSVGSISNPTINSASLINNGIDISTTYRQKIGNFNFAISGNISTLKNTVTKLGESNQPIYGVASKTEVGRPIGSIYGWKVEGIFQSTDDIDNSAKQINAKPGDIKFVDINNDGVIDDKDETYLGTAIPAFTYGFGINMNYKGFDFSTQFYGVSGISLFNSIKQALTSMKGYDNALKSNNNYWTPENTNTSIPRPTVNDPNQNTRNSDRYVEDGSYLKATNMQLGYTFTERFKKMNKYITKLRIYVSGDNLFTITKYSGLDPEIDNWGSIYSPGFDFSTYPAPRIFMTGIQLTF